MASPKFIAERSPRQLNKGLKAHTRTFGTAAASYSRTRRKPRKKLQEEGCIHIRAGNANITVRNQAALEKWRQRYPDLVVISGTVLP